MKQTPITRREQWREGILEMLKSAKSDEQGKLNSSSEAREQEVLLALAKECGAAQLIEEIDVCRNKSEQNSDELERLGFKYSDSGELDLKWDAPQKLRAEYNAELAKSQADQKSLKRFDSAILQVLKVETAAEARKVAETILG
jgi:hypothetical protein